MPIRYEPDGHVVLITIDRPEAHNCLDPEHNDALAGAFAAYEKDPELRVAVLTGAGPKSFCAGADLKTLIPPFRDAVRAGQSPPWVIGGITDGSGTKPRIAAVNGHALAGGMELALACDIRLASDNASLGLAETRWAIIPGAGGTQRLPRAVPLGAAMEIILTGDPVDAANALRIGLVNRVLPQAELLPAALELAATIASRGPLAVQAARRAVLDGLGMPLSEGMAMEYASFLEVMRTDDAAEGPRAFAEKRPPVYHGR
ncbi:MAG TPA: enoyl-CoA hydratase-related protein [Sporichthyaceae bacterium]|jgi:enoyl-CoA hydratase/carnithine racemase|nr:enoyl-CoA hydratase-related protein [Sporichthyaceae bacterium]